MKKSTLLHPRLLTISTAALFSTVSFCSVLAADQAAQQPLPNPHTKQVNHKQEANPDYSGWNDPAMKKVAIFSGQALLRHLSTADKALAENNVDKARMSIIAANDFAQSLKKMIPFMRITEEIKDSKGHILEAKTGYLLDDMLPVYENLEQLDFYAPELTSKVNDGKAQKNTTTAKSDKKKHLAHVEQLFEASDTTVYLPVLYAGGLIDNALSALNRKDPDIKTAKVAVEKALNSLTAVIASADLLQTQNPEKQKNQTADKITPVLRAELIRVKQSLAFAENLQKEAKHDPQYIYTSINDALKIVTKILNSDSLTSEIRSKLELLQKGILKIKANVNDTAAYAETRALLEPLTDNPGE